MLNISEFLSLIDKSGGLSRPNRYAVYIPTSKIAQASKAIFDAQSAIVSDPSGLRDWIKDFHAEQPSGLAGLVQKYYPQTTNIGSVTGISTLINQYTSKDTMNQTLAFVAYCQSASLPGYQFQMIDQKFYGPAFKVPHSPEYGDITMSFLCGSDMAEKYFMEAWMYMIMDPTTNDFNYTSEYACDVTIHQLNMTNSTTYSTKLIDAYPIAINSMGLSVQDDNFHKMEVTFTYKRLEPYQATSANSTISFATNVVGDLTA